MSDILAPDTLDLQPRLIKLSDYTNLRVTDAATLALAKEGMDAAAALIEEANKKFGKPCKDAHDLHKSLVGLRDGFLTPAKSLDEYLRKQVLAYDTKLERENQALKDRLQAKSEEDRAPWEDAVTIPLRPAKLPVTGLGIKRKPLRAEVFSLRSLVLSIAQRIQEGDNSGLVYLLPDLGAIAADARKWGRPITESRLPGVRIIDDEKTVSRK